MSESRQWALTAPDRQRLDAGTVVELFEIDATGIGGDLRRFVPGPWNGASVEYGEGPEYRPMPIEVTGVKRDLDGPEARPTMRMSRLDADLAAAVVGADNWRGARVTRTRVMARHLNGRPDADPNRHWPPEKWIVERLAAETKDELAWALASALSLDNRQLPGRQVLRDVCSWTYRRWDADADNGAGAWNYDDAECPYTGDAQFDVNDEPTSRPGGDKCSRRLSGCRKRFDDNDLPFGGFPGVNRLRTK